MERGCDVMALDRGTTNENKTENKKAKQMTALQTVQAWKDEDYRDTLTIEQQAAVPVHPAGSIDIQQAELADEGVFGPVRVVAGTFTGPCKCSTHHC